MSLHPEHRYSTSEYIEMDRASGVKSEYLDGVIYNMGGATARHVQIVGNLVRELGNQLRDQPCTVYSTDLRVCVDPKLMYAYPDVVVVYDDPQFLDSELDTLLNPVLLVEVLSETTKNYERGEKFERYRSIASFRGYVLVAQDRIHVEQFTRQPDETWTLAETNSIGDTLALSSVGCRVPLTEIYLKVQIPTH